MADENTNVTNTEGNATQTETETITLTQEEYNKKLQGEADRVRTEYSKRIKGLEAKIKELTPVEKTEAEKDFEDRLAALEAREKKMALLDSLTENGISSDFADYFKGDADIKAFSEIYKKVIDSEVQKKIQANGYVPADHKSGTQITKEDFAKMDMTAKEKLFNDNPDLYRSLAKK